MLVFVVGTGRCGTNLVRDVLNAHPSMYLPQETHWLPTLYDRFGMTRNAVDDYFDVIRRTHYHDGTRTLDHLTQSIGVEPGAFLDQAARLVPQRESTTVAEVGSAVYSAVARIKDRINSGDKTPEYGFYMSLILRLWPDARFVHVIRDGRAVAVSMSRHGGFQRMAAEGLTNWVPASLYADRNWDVPLAGGVRQGLSRARWFLQRRIIPSMGPRAERAWLERFVRLWETRIRRISDESTRIPQDRYLELGYERLLTDPRKELGVLGDFLGLDQHQAWMNAALSRFRTPRTKKKDAELLAHLTNVGQRTLEAYGYR